MMEDPLVLIKSKELEARNQVYDNPLKMKQIMKEIEALKNAGKKKKKSKKDKKKDKKKKKDISFSIYSSNKKNKKDKKKSKDASDESESESNSRSNRISSRCSRRSRSSSYDSNENSRRRVQSSSSEQDRTKSTYHKQSGYTSEKSHTSRATHQGSLEQQIYYRSRSRSPVNGRYQDRRENRRREDRRDSRSRSDSRERLRKHQSMKSDDKDRHRDYRNDRDGRDHRDDRNKPEMIKSSTNKSHDAGTQNQTEDKSRYSQNKIIMKFHCISEFLYIESNLILFLQQQDLGPDMKIYGEKARLQEQNEKLRKKQEPSYNVDKLTPEERERKIQEMMGYAKKHDEERNIKLFGSAQESAADIMKEQKDLDNQKDAKFLKNINQAAYMDSGLGLEERIGRNKHYIGRDAKRD